jgi:hypothetical protein
MSAGSLKRHRKRSSSRLVALLLLITTFPAISMSTSYAAVPTVSSISITSEAVVGGTLDTITGTNLSGAISVTVGGVVATLGNNTSTSIEFIIPPGSLGVQNVVVTTSGGGVTASTQITYYATLTPSCSISGFFTIQNNTVISQSGCTGNAVVPNGVTTIGQLAFAGNANRFSIDIPATVTTFASSNNYGPFNNSSLTAVTFQPNSQLTTIQSGAFRSTPYLQYISLPPTVTTMQVLSFSDYVPTNGLRWIEIPETVTTINMSTPYGAIDNYVPLTCVITPLGSTARTLAGHFTTGTNNSTAGAANPIFVTSVADCPAPTVSGISVSTGSANGGSSVTISGTNLWNVNSVTVGGVQATITSLPNTGSVTIKTPAGNIGAQAIVVSTPGPSVTASQSFTYSAPPVIGAISISSGLVSGGDTMTITGTGLTGVTSVKIGGVSASSIRSNTSTSVTVTTPVGIAGVKDVNVATAIDSFTAVGAFTYIQLVSTFSYFSLAGGVTNASYRAPIVISATVAYASKITFKSGGVRIPGCISLKTPLTAPFSVTCTWSPARRGAALLTASAIPNLGSIATGIAVPINVSITGRTSTR